MDNALLEYLLIGVASLAALVLFAVHHYIKKRLGKEHDDGYWWLATAMSIWAIMHAYELLAAPYLAPRLYEVGRRVLSILNTAALLYSLSYFKDNFLVFLERLNRLKRSYIALGLLVIFLLAYLINEGSWFWLEAILSSIVLALLFASMTIVLIRRQLVSVGLLAFATGLLFIYIQLAELQTTQSQFQSLFFNISELDKGILRLVVRIGLFTCLLVMALSWLGRQLEAEMMKRSPEKRAQFLRFEYRGERPYLVFRLQSENLFMSEQLAVDFNKNPVNYLKFKEAAAAQQLHGDFNTGTDKFPNFTAYRSSFLQIINRRLREEHPQLQLQSEHLFTRKGNGQWAFNFAADEIIIEP